MQLLRMEEKDVAKIQNGEVMAPDVQFRIVLDAFNPRKKKIMPYKLNAKLKKSIYFGKCAARYKDPNVLMEEKAINNEVALLKLRRWRHFV